VVKQEAPSVLVTIVALRLVTRINDVEATRETDYWSQQKINTAEHKHRDRPVLEFAEVEQNTANRKEDADEYVVKNRHQLVTVIKHERAPPESNMDAGVFVIVGTDQIHASIMEPNHHHHNWKGDPQEPGLP